MLFDRQEQTAQQQNREKLEQIKIYLNGLLNSANAFHQQHSRPPSRPSSAAFSSGKEESTGLLNSTLFLLNSAEEESLLFRLHSDLPLILRGLFGSATTGPGILAFLSTPAEEQLAQEILGCDGILFHFLLKGLLMDVFSYDNFNLECLSSGLRSRLLQQAGVPYDSSNMPSFGIFDDVFKDKAVNGKLRLNLMEYFLYYFLYFVKLEEVLSSQEKENVSFGSSDGMKKALSLLSVNPTKDTQKSNFGLFSSTSSGQKKYAKNYSAYLKVFKGFLQFFVPYPSSSQKSILECVFLSRSQQVATSQYFIVVLVEILLKFEASLSVTPSELAVKCIALVQEYILNVPMLNNQQKSFYGAYNEDYEVVYMLNDLLKKYFYGSYFKYFSSLLRIFNDPSSMSYNETVISLFTTLMRNKSFVSGSDEEFLLIENLFMSKYLSLLITGVDSLMTFLSCASGSYFFFKEEFKGIDADIKRLRLVIKYLYPYPEQNNSLNKDDVDKTYSKLFTVQRGLLLVIKNMKDFNGKKQEGVFDRLKEMIQAPTFNTHTVLEKYHDHLEVFNQVIAMLDQVFGDLPGRSLWEDKADHLVKNAFKSSTLQQTVTKLTDDVKWRIKTGQIKLSNKDVVRSSPSRVGQKSRLPFEKRKFRDEFADYTLTKSYEIKVLVYYLVSFGSWLNYVIASLIMNVADKMGIPVSQEFVEGLDRNIRFDILLRHLASINNILFFSAVYFVVYGLLRIFSFLGK